MMSLSEWRNLFALAVWLAFVGAGLLSVYASTRGRLALRQRAVHAALITMVLAMAVAGVTKRSLWPFDSWIMLSATAGREVGTLLIEGVDSTGQSYQVDARAWTPLSQEEITSWLGGPRGEIPDSLLDLAWEDLLHRANRARQRVASGQTLDEAGLLPAPWRAPFHFRRPRLWNQAEDVPDHDFVSIQMVFENWNVRVGRDRPSDIARQIVRVYP